MTSIPIQSHVSEPNPSGPKDSRHWTVLLTAIWILLTVGGGIGIYQRLTQGHLPAGYGSYVPWGLWIALYFHGVGLAAGVFIAGGLGFILGVPGLRRPQVLRTVIVLSLATLAAAFLAVLLDLGHMGRSYRIFTSPSFTSMMAFNAWMYTAFAIAASIAWWLSYKPSSGWLKPVLCLAGFFSILFPSQSGAFFGVVDSKPYWHSALLPILFLTSAVTAGSALLLVVISIMDRVTGGREWTTRSETTAAVGRLRVVILVGLAVYFVLEFAEYSVALWNPVSHATAIELVLYGPYWWVFWIVHLLIGGILPLVVLATRRPSVWPVAAALVAIAFVSTRLNVLIPGQAVGEIRGLQEAFADERLTYVYHATTMEYLVGLFLIAVAMAVFFIGRRVSGVVANRWDRGSVNTVIPTGSDSER